MGQFTVQRNWSSQAHVSLAEPTNFSTSAGDGQVDLSWTDNSDNESGFEIFRSTSSGFSPSSSNRITTTSADAESYTDTGVSNDTTYYYKIRATDGSGHASPLPAEASGTPQAAGGSTSTTSTGDPQPTSGSTIVYDMREGGNQDLQASGLNTLSDVRNALDNVTFSGTPFDPYITDTFLGDGTRAFGFPIHKWAGEDSCKGNGLPPDGSQQNMIIQPNLFAGDAWDFNNEDPPPGTVVYWQYKRWFGRTSDDGNSSARGTVGDWLVHHDGTPGGPGGRKWNVWKRNPESGCGDRIDILKQNLSNINPILANSLVLDGINEDGKTGDRIADFESSGSDRIILGQGDIDTELTEWWPDAHPSQVNTITYRLKLESAADAQDGEFTYWVNGEKIFKLTGLATCSEGLKSPELGFPTWVCPPQDQTEYFWDFVCWEGDHEFNWKTWSSPEPQDVQIPAASDFTDQGEVVPVGAVGEWDHRIDGAFNHISVQKKGETMYMYYIGADGDRSDGGPANRAIGYASSTDGLNWTKAGEGGTNPLILDQADPDNDEQGHFSGGMWTDGETLHLMSGTMALGVDGSGDYWSSTDGINFSLGQRNVIDPTSNALGGDENFPFGAYEHDGTVYVFYSAKGGVDNWTFALQDGPSWTDLPNATNLGFNNAKAGGQVIKKNSTTYLIPVGVWSDPGSGNIEIRSFSPGSPSSQTVEATWDISTFDASFKECNLYLDRDIGKWFLFWNSGDDGVGIECATAPMNTV